MLVDFLTWGPPAVWAPSPGVTARWGMESSVLLVVEDVRRLHSFVQAALQGSIQASLSPKGQLILKVGSHPADMKRISGPFAI